MTDQAENTHDNVQYGLRADEDDPDGTVHAADAPPANAAFHPISLCGETLTRELSDTKPKKEQFCGSCNSILEPSSKKSSDVSSGGKSDGDQS